MRWVVTEAEREAYQSVLVATDARLRRVLEGLVNSGEKDAIFTPAFHLWNGKTGRGVVVPIYSRENFLGFVIAVFHEEKAFENILSNHAELGYAIVVFEDNEEVYRMRGSSPENEKEWGQDAELHLTGATWRIRVWPKPELLRGIESRLPELALIAGALIGLVFFMTLNFARTAYFKSQELRRAHHELELWIQERTAELQSTNNKLEAEIHDRRQA